MRLVYDLGILLYGAILRVIAPFHGKAKRWVDGRKNLLRHIEQTIEVGQQHIWFHFASLGEFEQGRAVMEQIRAKYPVEKIVVTFFSPSGYEIRKNSPLADYVFYLPEDTARNARRFIQLINPKFVVFTKYEYWHHYFNELHKRNIRLLMISAIFREDQLFFKSYGGFYKNILRKVSFFFTQNMDSVHMLKWIGITNAGLAGDTRFDRVIELAKQKRSFAMLDAFVSHHKVLVAGSTWPADEEKLVTWAAQHPDWKLVLAPHEIHEEHVQRIQRLFPDALRYSLRDHYSETELSTRQTLVIDNIGMLSSLYNYADITYIGGGFGAGIHNTLEAATYGKPVVFGPRYEKFQEAIDLLTLGAAFAIENTAELEQVFGYLSAEDNRITAGESAANYVQQRAGATQIIMKYIETEGLLINS